MNADRRASRLKRTAMSMLCAAALFGLMGSFGPIAMSSAYAQGGATTAAVKKKTVAECEADMARAKQAVASATNRGDTTALRAADSEYRAASFARQTALWEQSRSEPDAPSTANPLGTSNRRPPPPPPETAGSSQTVRAKRNPLGVRSGDFDPDDLDIDDGGVRLGDIRPIDPDDEFDLLDEELQDQLGRMRAAGFQSPEFQSPGGKLILKNALAKSAGSSASRAAEIKKWKDELRDIDAAGRAYVAAGNATQAQVNDLARRQQRAFAELERLGEPQTYGGTINVRVNP